MSDFDDYDEDDERFVSLDDLAEEEELERPAADDWGDDLDDQDSEFWDRQYSHEEEELEDDPWDLN